MLWNWKKSDFVIINLGFIDSLSMKFGQDHRALMRLVEFVVKTVIMIQTAFTWKYFNKILKLEMAKLVKHKKKENFSTFNILIFIV